MTVELGVEHSAPGADDMRDWYQHRPTRPSPAAPGPGSFRPAPPAPVADLAGDRRAAAHISRCSLGPAMTAAPRAFSFTNFVTQVDANQVKTATIDPNGQVSGRLANGDRTPRRCPPPSPIPSWPASYWATKSR